MIMLYDNVNKAARQHAIHCDETVVLQCDVQYLNENHNRTLFIICILTWLVNKVLLSCSYVCFHGCQNNKIKRNTSMMS